MDIEMTNQRDTEDTKADTGTTPNPPRKYCDRRGRRPSQRRNDFHMTKRLPEKNATRNDLLIKKIKKKKKKKNNNNIYIYVP